MAPRPLDVRIWAVGLEDGVADPSVLSAAETARARSMPGERGALYGLAHTVLRLVLAPRAGVEAGRLHFSRRCRHCGAETHGKPFLVGSELDFSLSYGPGLAVVAVAAGGRLGVDVHGLDETTGLHRLWVSEDDRARLGAVEPHDRAEAVGRAWARKEAVAKADGRGLALPMSAIEGLAARPGPRLVARVPGEPRVPGETWHVHDIELRPWAPAPVVAALATDAVEVTLEVARYGDGA